MVWGNLSKTDDRAKSDPAPAEWLEWRRLNTVFTDIASTQPTEATLFGDVAVLEHSLMLSLHVRNWIGMRNCRAGPVEDRRRIATFGVQANHASVLCVNAVSTPGVWTKRIVFQRDISGSCTDILNTPLRFWGFSASETCDHKSLSDSSCTLLVHPDLRNLPESVSHLAATEVTGNRTDRKKVCSNNSESWFCRP